MFKVSNTLVLVHIFVSVTNICYTDPLYLHDGQAGEGEFPFVVSIGSKSHINAYDPYGHICGGALITSKRVLTSLTCFAENSAVDNYLVYIGSNDLQKSFPSRVIKWTTYDDWVATKKQPFEKSFRENDLVIVEIPTLIGRSIVAKITKSPPRNFEGRKVITAGWGRLNTTFPRYLLKSDLQVISHDQCIRNIRGKSNVSTYIHENNIFCTNGAELFSVLEKHDRGSPVFIKNKNGHYEIIGINLNAAPKVTSIVDIPDQQNKHISVHYYLRFLTVVANAHHHFV